MRIGVCRQQDGPPRRRSEDPRLAHVRARERVHEARLAGAGRSEQRHQERQIQRVRARDDIARDVIPELSGAFADLGRIPFSYDDPSLVGEGAELACSFRECSHRVLGCKHRAATR